MSATRSCGVRLQNRERRVRPANVTVFALNAGVLKTETQRILKDTRAGTPMDIPVVFLILKREKDWIAFDTGCNRRLVTDPVEYWGKELSAAFMPVVRPEQTFREAIKVLGLAPADLKAVFCSHGHSDHSGALDEFLGTDVPIYFQSAEIEEMRSVFDSRVRSTPYFLSELEVLSKLNVRSVSGVSDIFDDGSLVVFPTPGHTRGHQSLYISPVSSGAFIYCADALYTIENMEKCIPPAIADDVPCAMQTMNWFKFAEKTGLKIVPSHDPEYWSRQQWAPQELTF